MNSKTCYQNGTFERLECDRLNTAGIEHGFTGVGLSFSPGVLDADFVRFCREFKVVDLFFLRQTHGAIYHFIDTETDISVYSCAAHATESGYAGFPEGDAFIARCNESSGGEGRRIAMAVRTADCVPVIIATERHMAVIHAGWRGIAAQIVSVVLEEIRRREGGLFTEALVVSGPCAGACSYQVGPEVLEAIGSCAVSVADQSRPGHVLLDMPATIERQINASGSSGHFEFIDTRICTISDRKFHSFRRDKDSAGRNLCYLIVSL